MSREAPEFDWCQLLHDCRGYLGLANDAPVPLDELKAQTRAHGYHDSEVDAAVRATDVLEAVDDNVENPRVTLVDETSEETWGEAPSAPELEHHSSGSVSVDDCTVAATGWTNVDFANTTVGMYPPVLLEREQWMGRRGKLPFAPWGSRNADVECTHMYCREHSEFVDSCDACEMHREGTTCAECVHDARWKWGFEENLADGDSVALAEDDPRLDGRVFIQMEADPFAFVDGDDVRCPETGEPHPAFVEILERLGMTYADVSTSGSGSHAYYRGSLPNGMSQAVFDIDTEPWGANDDAPSVEIYAGKHVCVATGDHVNGTPLEVTEWDDDELRDVLEKYDALADPRIERVDHDTDRELDIDNHEPTVTVADETTADVRDVLTAVDRLRPSDLPLRTSTVGTDGTGWEKWDPSSYRTSSGNDSLHRPADEAVFHDHKHGESFGVLSLFAAEQGILSKPWDRLRGHEWWDAIDSAREAGAPIPEYLGAKSRDTEQTAVLPAAVRDLTHASSGWDWRHTAEQGDDTLTVDATRERTVEAISDAYTRNDRVLVEALPTMGKSYGCIAAAAATGEQISVFTGRGLKEQYEQFREWCDEHSLSHYTLPSFTRDCDTANGEYGEEWADTVRGWYTRGATPKEIHKAAEYVLDRPLPCQEHEGTQCPYASKWDFDPDEYDVLIGHYAHAHKSKATSGRVCVFDEFPDAYETLLGPELQGAVSYWLECTDGVPFDSYTDLLENRDDQTRRADALLWFDEHGIESDELHVFDDRNAHAAAPLAVFTLLASDDLENGFERAKLEDSSVGVFNRASGAVSVLRQPALNYASGVVALDGTPTKRMWELAIGESLNHRPVLQDDERAEYIRDALNLNLVRTTEYVKPYNSVDHVSTEQDAALLESIVEAHGERPAVITTTTAEDEYDAKNVNQYISETKHYGNVLGSNEYDDTRLGGVFGSNHYGDSYIKKWGAYAGDAVERGDGKGAGLSYTGIGDQILAHMREHDTLQAAMRFGRDGNGAVVYVHTNTLPEWVPLAGEGRVVKTWSNGMRDVLRALEDLDRATTAEIGEHSAVELSRQQVFSHLEELRERGVLYCEQDVTDGRRVVWVDDELHRIGEHGDVELEAVDLDDLTDDEVRQVTRSDIYTWEFTNIATEEEDSLRHLPSERSSPTPAPLSGRNPSPANTD